jgi:uncharacterized membrane protein
MKKMVRCKACGYIMEEGKLGDRCPACGAPKVAFMPYVDPVSEPRRRLLNFHLHPIAVHFPTTLAVAILVFSIPILFLSGDSQTLLISTNKILSLFLPLTVILAGVVGFVDGKTRFRKIKNSAILKRKIVYASFLLAISVALTVLVWTQGFENAAFTSVDALLSALAVGLIVALALLGMSFKDAAFPGN